MEPEESVVSPSVVSSIGGGFAILSGYAFIGLSFLIVAEVAARKLFGVSFQSVDEISGYVVAVVSPFAFAYALMMAAHTRIESGTSSSRRTTSTNCAPGASPGGADGCRHRGPAPRPAAAGAGRRCRGSPQHRCGKVVRTVSSMRLR